MLQQPAVSKIQQSSLSQQIASSSVAAVAPTELMRLFEKFFPQVAHSQIIPSARPVPIPISPASIDGSTPVSIQVLQHSSSRTTATTQCQQVQLQQVQL